MRARNYLTGIALHFGLILGGLLLAIPFFRHTARKYVYQPGDGATKEETKTDRIEYRVIAKPDNDQANPPRIFCRESHEGSIYGCEWNHTVLNVFARLMQYSDWYIDCSRCNFTTSR